MSNTESKTVLTVDAAEAERNALIDQICANLGARYHDLRLFKVVNN